MLQKQLRWAMSVNIYSQLRAFQNSAAQEHLKHYLYDGKLVQEIKKTIDFSTINRTQGTFMFKQFAFQEETTHTIVPPLNVYIMPNNKWTAEEIFKKSQGSDNKTNTELENQFLVEKLRESFESIFNRYYTAIGKPSYQFILKEEVNKIANLSKESFDNFIDKVSKTYSPPEHKKKKEYFNKWRIPTLDQLHPKKDEETIIKENIRMADRKRKRISKEDSYKPEKLDDGSAVTVEEAKKDKSQTVTREQKDKQARRKKQESSSPKKSSLTQQSVGLQFPDEQQEYSNQKGIKPKRKHQKQSAAQDEPKKVKKTQKQSKQKDHVEGKHIE